MKQLIITLVFISIVSKSFSQRQFVTLWDTRLGGVTSNNQLEYIFETLWLTSDYSLKTKPNSTSIIWEKLDNPSMKGKKTFKNDFIITFPEPGIYKITHDAPTFPENVKEEFHTEYEYYSDLYEFKENYKIVARREARFENLYIGDAPKLIDVLQWDNMYCSGIHLFEGCENLDITAKDAPIFNGDCSYMFKGCVKLKGNESFNEWSMCKVFKFNSMFENCKIFNTPINKWCMYYAVEAQNMFYEATNFNQPIGQWRFTKNLKNIDRMLFNAKSFAQDLTQWKFKYEQVSYYQAYLGTITEEKNWLPGETISEFTANYIIEQNNKTKEQREDENCEMRLNGSFESIRMQYDAAKKAFDNETNYGMTGQGVSGKLGDVIRSLQKVKENLNSMDCKNSMGAETVSKLENIIIEKLNVLETTKKNYDEGNKKIGFVDALLMGLQVGTGTYDK